MKRYTTWNVMICADFKVQALLEHCVGKAHYDNSRSFFPSEDQGVRVGSLTEATHWFALGLGDDEGVESRAYRLGSAI